MVNTIDDLEAQLEQYKARNECLERQVASSEKRYNELVKQYNAVATMRKLMSGILNDINYCITDMQKSGNEEVKKTIHRLSQLMFVRMSSLKQVKRYVLKHYGTDVLSPKSKCGRGISKDSTEYILDYIRDTIVDNKYHGWYKWNFNPTECVALVNESVKKDEFK